MKNYLVLVLIFLGLTIQAQNDTAFIYTYGGGGDDEGKDIIETADGGYLIVGSTSSFGNGNSDVYLVKLDSAFKVMWSKAYGGPQIERGESVLPATDGGYYVIGYTNSYGMGGYDVYLVKVDANGEKEWEDYYGGANWDFAYDAALTPTGDLIIVGESYSFNGGDAQAYVLKVDAFGGLLWEKDFGGGGVDLARAICFTSDSNFVFTGETNKFTEDGNADVWLLKFNSNGAEIWEKAYGGDNFDTGYDVTFDSTHFYIAGSSRSFSLEDDLNEYVVKTDSSGLFIWGQDRKQNGNGANLDDEAYGISLRPNGRILVTGSVRTFGAGSEDMIISELGVSGFETPNSGSFGEFRSDIGYKIYAKNNFDLILIGKTNSFGSEYFNVGLLYMDTIFKLDAMDIRQNIDSQDTSSSQSFPFLGKKQEKDTNSITIYSRDSKIVILNQSDFPFNWKLCNILGEVVLEGQCLADSEDAIEVKHQPYYILIGDHNGTLEVKKIPIIR